MSNSPVLAAACSGLIAQLREALNTHGHLIDSPNDSRWTPLSGAAHFGHAEAVRILIQSGSRAMDTPGHQGMTPLCAAAQFGHLEAIETLVRLGSSALDVPDDEGYTPLCRAVIFGKVEAIEMLIRFGSRALETPNKHGETPMQEASVRGRTGPPIIRLLRAFGVAEPPRLPPAMRMALNEDEAHEIRCRTYFADSLADCLLIELQRVDVSSGQAVKRDHPTVDKD